MSVNLFCLTAKQNKNLRHQLLKEMLSLKEGFCRVFIAEHFPKLLAAFKAVSRLIDTVVNESEIKFELTIFSQFSLIHSKEKLLGRPNRLLQLSR